MRHNHIVVIRSRVRMRQLCGRCEGPLREDGSYAAVEGAEELEINVWVCTSCEIRLEIPAPAPALDRAVA